MIFDIIHRQQNIAYISDVFLENTHIMTHSHFQL